MTTKIFPVTTNTSTHSAYPAHPKPALSLDLAKTVITTMKMQSCKLL